jgi:ATP-dependent exoDNAse (exonuclease V) beta subunit
MVDEFQDSNPIQLKIFNQLSELLADVNGHSYWVGDPKQAIYGFRGADTELVNSVSKYFHFYNDAMIHAEEGENRLGSGRLTESWRSRSELVDLVNETFLEPFKMDGINDLLITLAPHYKRDNIDAPSICHLKSSAKNADDAANELAYYVSNMLHKDIVVHHGKQDEMPTPITPKDIAILCRQNAQCSKIINALRRYNVPVSEPEDNLMQRLEVQLTLSILRYIQNPYSKATIAGLKRLMFNESVSDILRSRIEYIQGLKSKDCQQSADCWQEDSVELNKLAELVSHFKNLSISEIVKSIIYRCDIISLCAKWGDYNTRMQNLLTLQSLADDYDQVCLQMGLGSSISGFIYYLNSVEPQKIKDNMSDTVKVFTYHSAKGLEWPMVIMYDLDANVLNDASFVKKQFMKVREIVDESDNSSVDNPFAKKYYLHYVPCVACGNSNVAQTVSDKIISLPLYQELKRRACSEERRLLYVGMTRAKDYLYTFSRGNNFTFTWLQNAGVNNPTIVSPWGNDNHIPLAEELSLPIDSCEEVQESYDTLDKPESHIMREPRYISPSKLESFANAYSSHRQWTEHGEKIDTTGWGSEYAKIGTCIHDIFAVYRHDNHALSEKLAKQVIYGYGLTDRLTSKVQAILESAKWLYDLLMSKFPQSESDNTHCELPFMSTLENGQVLRGEIDLLWEYTDKNGVKQCVLVDYKTFPGVALNEHTTKYYAQLSAYAKALKAEGYTLSNALVYYPVHGIIYELLKDNSDN